METGIYRDKNEKYFFRFRRNGKLEYHGGYSLEKDAIDARAKLIRSVYGDCLPREVLNN